MAAGGLALGQPASQALESPGVSPPNIIIMLADDLGYGDLACYGCPNIETPRLDRLAAEGCQFSDAYASAPVCSPTRVALMTGQYQQRLGHAYEDYLGAGAPAVDPVDAPCIAHYLKEAGYATACYGKWNISGEPNTPPNAYGFDHWVGIHHNCHYFTHRGYDFADQNWTGPNRLMEDGNPLEAEGYITDIFAQYAIDRIHQAGTQPFFIYLPWQAPHSPLQAPGDDPQGPAPKGVTPDMRPTNRKIIERLDYQTGRIMAALRETGREANTLVMFTSDNGGHRAARNAPFRGGKQDLWEGGIRVPLIMRWPEVITAGRRARQPAITMDLTATALAAAGAAVPEGVPQDGIDLIPYLTGSKPVDAERPLYWRRRVINHPRSVDEVRARAMRRGRWKFHEETVHGRSHLHDLSADPGESNDLIKERPELAAELEHELKEWERRVTPG
jgi:arylsulfatase A-like enzyme